MYEAWLIAFWLFLLGMGWYPCCCPEGGDLVGCNGCPDDIGPPTGFSFTIASGFNDGLCDCELLHGTWNIPVEWSVGDQCGGDIIDEDVGCTSTSGSELSMTVADVAGDTYEIRLQITIDRGSILTSRVLYTVVLDETTACEDVLDESMSYSSTEYWEYLLCTGEEDLVISVSAY